MIRPVLGTIATRIIVMLMNIAVIMLAGHHLGAGGLGDISLVVLGITFIMLFNNVIGGGSLVYLLPRHSLRDLLLPSYAWAFITAVIALVVVHLAPLVPYGTEPHVVALAFIQSIYTIHFSILLGRQRIRNINFLQIVQAVILLGSFSYLLQRGEQADIMTYIKASYAAFGATMAGSVITMALLRFPVRHGGGSVIPRMMKQGGLIQLANFLQLLNYRLAYYLIERFQGTAALGIYSVANQLAESAWLAPKSIGSVLYGRVSNITDPKENQRITITALKAATVLAMAVVLVVVVVPDRAYQWLFGHEITGVSRLVLMLSPGIIAMAISQALSHYYSGIGANKHNVIGSGIGVVATMTAGLLLIPRLGLSGAAITASLAYVSNTCYQLIVFLRTTGTPLAGLWPDARDKQRIADLLRRVT